MATSNSGKPEKGLRATVIGMVAFVVIVGIGFTLMTNHSKSVLKLPASVSKADGYGIVFNPTAKPVIDIWEDFQCPVCQRFEAINSTYINQVVAAGKAKVVFHPMSFIGQESVLAANAAACANDQGKFLAYHTLLYQNQSPTENSGKVTADFLTQLGAAGGISGSKFTGCVNNMSYQNWTKNIEVDAASKNVNSTPTVFVNGKELDRKTQYMDPAAFQAVLAAGGVK